MRDLLLLLIAAAAVLVPATAADAGEPLRFTIGDTHFERLDTDCPPERTTYRYSLPDCPDMVGVRTFAGATPTAPQRGRYLYADGTRCIGGDLHGADGRRWVYAYRDAATGASWIVEPGRYRITGAGGRWGGTFWRL